VSEREPADPRLEPELEQLARMLDETARQEERDLAAAAARPAPRDRAALEERMDALWRGLDQRRRRARWLKGAGLAAAAAALVLLLLLRSPGGPEPGPGGELLGGSEVEVLPPGEGLRAWERLEWRGPGGPYVLRVYDAESGALLLGPRRVDAERYSPTPEERAGWPVRIRIELEWRRPDGTPERASGEARLPR
jgi:hypothetical protein